MAQGSRFGGQSLFVKDGRLYYIYNFLGVGPDQTLVTQAPTPDGTSSGLTSPSPNTDQHCEPHGPAPLYLDHPPVVRIDDLRTHAVRYALAGEGLCRIRRRRYRQQPVRLHVRLHLRAIHRLIIDVGEDAYIALEHHFAAALARDERVSRFTRAGRPAAT